MALRRREYHPDAVGPLSGVRVLDLSRLVCGNTVTMLLADHGAEVIKVEPPQGDTLRAWRSAGIELHWKMLARNKKSLCLDLRRKEAIDIIRDLVRASSIFVESFRPGTLEKMGLGPDALFAIRPDLVIVRVSGFGQDGPYSKRPGFGSLVEGMSGFAAMSGFADREPLLPPNALADGIAGYAGAMGALMALRAVEVNGGKGQVVDVPLFDPLFSTLGPMAAQYRLTGKLRGRSGSRSNTAGPRNVYRTSDGKFVALSASIQAMAERLFIAIGRPDLIEDPRYRDNSLRVANAEELDAIIGAFIGRMTQAETLTYFDKAEVTIGPIYDICDIIEDPHFQQREVVVDLPDEDIGLFPMSGIVPRLLGTPGEFFRPAPKLGQDSAEILDRTRFSVAEKQRFFAEGIVMGTTKSTSTRKSTPGEVAS
jgi:crotonobetainyl-CoA:carnitine CoA-transferase CaiB-like acyl-CoA transferase